jgi:hypothetical protein
MLFSGTQVRGFEPGRSHRIFHGKKILSMPSFGGKLKPSDPSRRFAAWNSPFDGKIADHFSLTVPLSLLEFSRVSLGVGKPGVASGNFQSRASTLNLHGCSTSEDTSHRGPIEEEEEEEGP